MSAVAEQLPLPELADYLAEFDRRCASRQWWHAKCHVRVLRDICADVLAWIGRLARGAHAAECDDAEAERLMTDALADGRVMADEMPLLQRALRHIRSSREKDHNLAAQLTLPLAQ